MDQDRYGKTTSDDDELDIVLGADIPDVADGTHHTRVHDLRSFEVDDQDHPGEKRKLLSYAFETDDGIIVEGVSSMATSPKSKLWAWMSAILGPEAMAHGARIRRSDVVGREVLVRIEHKGEWPRVVDVFPLPRAKAA